MNTDITTAAVQNLSAQLGAALFGQPELNLIEIANRCNAEASRAGGALLTATGKQQVGEVQGDVLAVRKFIADRAPSDEDREDILSGEYDHTAWFGHIRELMTALAARQSDTTLASIYELLGVCNESDAGAEIARLHIAARKPVEHTFQAGVSEWMGQCFLPSLYSNMTERGDRLLEEVLELLQAHGYDKARVPTLVDYVFSRPVGEPSQEVGGVMVTLAGYCWVAGIDMHDASAAELQRITQPEVMDKIRRKQEAKNALHFDTPLPGSSSPPAQAVDLGHLATLVRHARVYLQDGLNSQCMNKLDDVQALIDSQAVKS